MSKKLNPLLPYGFDDTGDGTGGGGVTTLAPQYHKTDKASSTVTYSGINSSSSDPADANWTIVKLVTDETPERTRTVYTASGIWNNRASLTYTPSLSYSI